MKTKHEDREDREGHESSLKGIVSFVSACHFVFDFLEGKCCHPN